MTLQDQLENRTLVYPAINRATCFFLEPDEGFI